MKTSYDVVVVGAGPAGINAATLLGRAGKSVLLVDPNLAAAYCNYGSAVSNTLLHISYLYERFENRTQEFLKMETDCDFTFDFSKAKKYSESIATKMKKGFTDDIVDANVMYLKATARFSSANTVTIIITTDDDVTTETEVSFTDAIIATGSINRKIDIPSTKKLLDTTNLFQLESVPATVAIIGGGFVGCEYATFFRRIGAQVTIFEREERLLADFDPQVIKKFEDQMKKNGIELVKNAVVEKVEKVGNKSIIFLEDSEKKEAEEVFVAIGRIPNMANLDLSAANVACEGLEPELDEGLRSVTNEHVYVVGDATGKQMLVNWAYRSAEIAVAGILGKKQKLGREFLPKVLYIDPEIAGVGQSEEEAKVQGIETGTVKYTYTNIERSLILGTNQGFLKAVYDKKTKRILGCSIVGGGASELVSMFALLIQSGVKINRISDYVFNHPTFAEVLSDIGSKVK